MEAFPEGIRTRSIRSMVAKDQTLDDARKTLHENAYLRRVSETLARLYGMKEDDLEGIREKTRELLQRSDPEAKPDTVRKNVANWTKENTLVIDRNSSLKLICALELPLKEAEGVFQRLCWETLHWRSPEDIVWIFAIRHGMSYQEGLALCEEMAPVWRLPEGTRIDEQARTELFKEQILALHTREELRSFLQASAPSLGTMRNTAYEHFMNYMKKMRAPGDVPEESKVTDTELVSIALCKRFVPEKRFPKNTIEGLIKLNLPDEARLSNMQSRREDVTRKVLILLFLASDEGLQVLEGEEEATPEEVFEDLRTRLDGMLADCGFSVLDPRNPFDWMILYSMMAEDMMDMDKRLQDFLKEIYG